LPDEILELPSVFHSFNEFSEFSENGRNVSAKVHSIEPKKQVFEKVAKKLKLFFKKYRFLNKTFPENVFHSVFHSVFLQLWKTGIPFIKPDYISSILQKTA
jgi:hypothetical protein